MSPATIRKKVLLRGEESDCAVVIIEHVTPAGAPRSRLQLRRGRVLVRLMGIGGTGAVTVAQIIGTAALVDGHWVRGLDQTGLAQKGGQVVSDIRLSPEPVDGAAKAIDGQADLLLAFDALAAASDKNITVR
jgi:indolepyruvate ferredoxin oxidoreductase